MDNNNNNNNNNIIIIIIIIIINKGFIYFRECEICTVHHAYRSNPLSTECSSAAGPSIFNLEKYQSGFLKRPMKFKTIFVLLKCVGGRRTKIY